ncbi:hypothetical protein [Nonomuraea roseola]|uniref:Uncharacterized protein n=1 Tax=Nonomuraea roseola TaxID=46179 RepID=A0ABV5QF26_9ACTN
MTDHRTGLVLSGSRVRLEINRRIMATMLHTGTGRRRILGRLSGLDSKLRHSHSRGQTQTSVQFPAHAGATDRSVSPREPI